MDRRPHRPSRRALLALLAAALPIIPILVAFGLNAGAATTRRTTAASPTASAPAVFKPVSTPVRRHATRAGTLVALLLHPASLDGTPGGRPLGHLGLRTQFGSPEAMAVAATRPGWVGVLSPVAGNGRLGWLPDRDVSLGRVTWSVRVSLRTRTITVTDSGHVLARFRTAIGRPDAPTPTGHFAVTDRLLTGQPQGPYGCCVLALSALAPHAISGWDGGNRIAIHATVETASIGEDVSHGCLRITDAEARWLIERVPLGTPVTISS